ncbi:HUA2-like protein 3-like [Trifolium medium]|uniref:HUA2-like protein 3-like n=1 Tax=Trifolium medium TaxID=97028 RepID=A0A392PH66_9FABA|nr:HUA2-like protein 3-like [Trifolium medium]
MIFRENKSSFEEDKQLAKSQQHESGNDVIPGAKHQIGEDPSDSVVCAPAKIDSQVLMHEKLSPNLDVKCCQVGGNQDSPKADESIRPAIHSTTSDTLDHHGINFDPVAGPNESGELLPQKCISTPQNLMVVCEDMKGTADDRSQINDT